jgi:hypothetical protein
LLPTTGPTFDPGQDSDPTPDPKLEGGNELDIRASDDEIITEAVISLFDPSLEFQVKSFVENSLLPNLSDSAKSELATMSDLGEKLSEQLKLERKDRGALFKTITSEISKMQKNIC